MLRQLSFIDRTRLYLRAVPRVVDPIFGSHALAMLIPALIFQLRAPLGWEAATIFEPHDPISLFIFSFFLIFVSGVISHFSIILFNRQTPSWKNFLFGFLGAGLFSALMLYICTVPHDVQALRVLEVPPQSAKVENPTLGSPKNTQDPSTKVSPFKPAMTDSEIKMKEIQVIRSKAVSDNTEALALRLFLPLLFGAPLAFMLQALSFYFNAPRSTSQPKASALGCVMGLLRGLAWPFVTTASIIAHGVSELVNLLADKSILDEDEWSKAEQLAIARSAKKAKRSQHPSTHRL